MEESAVFCKTHAPHSEGEFWRYPSHKVLSIFEDAENVSAALSSLKQAGIDDDKIEIFCGKLGEDQIDFSGEKHGVLGAVVRYFQELSSEHSYLEYYKKELHSGNYLFEVAVTDSDQKQTIARLLHDNGGKRVTYFGTWIIEEIANKVRHVENNGYGFVRTVDLNFETALERVKETLKEQGFGVLTEIDLKAKFKEKLDKEFPNYVILGACNPGFAFQGLQTDMDLGLLLPCNVIVYEDRGKVKLSAIEAVKQLSIAQRPELNEVAAAVDERLRKAIDNV